MKIEILKVRDIEENPDNARGKNSFTKADLADLSESIRQFGVAVPLIVRKNGKDGHILIAGHRRLAAARLAKVETVPAIIHEEGPLTPEMVAMLENQHRKPLTILEELNAVQTLLSSVEDNTSIRDMLGLNALQLRLRKNIVENLDDCWKKDLPNLPEMNVGSLELIARMPAGVQQAFYDDYKGAFEFDSAITGKALVDYVREQLDHDYMVNLKTKPWPEDWKAEDPLLGVCSECLARSDKIGQGELFEAPKAKKAKIVMCMNSGCFRSKKISWILAQYKEAWATRPELQVMASDSSYTKEKAATIEGLRTAGAKIIANCNEYKFAKIGDKGAIPVFVIGGEHDCKLMYVKSALKAGTKTPGKKKIEGTEEKLENLHGLRLKIVFAELKEYIIKIDEPTKYFGRNDLIALLVAFGSYGCSRTFGTVDEKLITALAAGSVLEFKHPWNENEKAIKADIDLAMWIQVIGSILRAIPDKGTAQDTLDAEKFVTWFGNTVQFDFTKAMEKAMIEKPEPKGWTKTKKKQM